MSQPSRSSTGSPVQIKQEDSPVPQVRDGSGSSSGATTSDESSTDNHRLTEAALTRFSWLNRGRSVTHPSPPLDLPTLVNIPNSLKKFARGGGPDTTNLRGYPRPNRRRAATSSLSGEPSPKRTRRTQSPGPAHEGNIDRNIVSPSVELRSYESVFLNELIANGIYPDSYRWPDTDTASPRYPGNWTEIVDRTFPMRPSLLPFNEEEHVAFKAELLTQHTKVAATSYFASHIACDEDMPRMNNDMSLKFSNLRPLFWGIAPAKPDFYDGAHPNALGEDMKYDLSHFITPSDMAQTSILPNFFVSITEPGKSPSVAYKSAIYNGVLGARAIMQLQSYRSHWGLVVDGNAYTITNTYGDGTLRMYAVFPEFAASDPSNWTVNYQVTQIGGWDLTGSLTQYRAAVCALRNLRQWAKEQRDKLVESRYGQVLLCDSSVSDDLERKPSVTASSSPH